MYLFSGHVLIAVKFLLKRLSFYFKGRNFREWKNSRNLWNKLSRISCFWIFKVYYVIYLGHYLYMYCPFICILRKPRSANRCFRVKSEFIDKIQISKFKKQKSEFQNPKSEFQNSNKNPNFKFQIRISKLKSEFQNSKS